MPPSGPDPTVRKPPRPFCSDTQRRITSTTILPTVFGEEPTVKRRLTRFGGDLVMVILHLATRHAKWKYTVSTACLTELGKMWGASLFLLKSTEIRRPYILNQSSWRVSRFFLFLLAKAFGRRYRQLYGLQPASALVPLNRNARRGQYRRLACMK